LHWTNTRSYWNTLCRICDLIDLEPMACTRSVVYILIVMLTQYTSKQKINWTFGKNSVCVSMMTLISTVLVFLKSNRSITGLSINAECRCRYEKHIDIFWKMINV